MQAPITTSTSRSRAPSTSQASAFRRRAYRLDVSRIPMFQPAPRPRFSALINRTSGKRSRTKSTVPSRDPLSTTIVSTPRSDSRQGSIQGRASYVTTTAATRGSLAMLDPRSRLAAKPFPEQDRATRHRQQQGDEEVEETGRERLVRADADAPEEANEERLPHGEPVQRERHEHDEEQERSEHVIDPRIEVDAHGPRRCPDRQDPDRLDGKRDREHLTEQPRPATVVVDTLVERLQRAREAYPLQQWLDTSQQRPGGAREEHEDEHEGPEDEHPLEPEVRADVVAADREEETDRAEQDGRCSTQPALEKNRARHDCR